MKNVGGTSEYIAFFDECGDHTLELIDKDFPLFLLATVDRTDQFTYSSNQSMRESVCHFQV